MSFYAAFGIEDARLVASDYRLFNINTNSVSVCGETISGMHQIGIDFGAA
jgi:hypothetical protein